VRRQPARPTVPCRANRRELVAFPNIAVRLALVSLKCPTTTRSTRCVERPYPRGLSHSAKTSIFTSDPVLPTPSR
jgi:hypothetical protein